MWSIEERSRSYVKVQDGCNYPCTYCTIPLARGKSRSDFIKNIISKIEDIGSKGTKEVVLTGVNIGDYKEPISNKNFYDLINEIEKVDVIDRFRISSIEPNLITDEIIDFVKNSKKFVPHFHIPLQSGSNKILGLMKRRYRKELYEDRIRYIHSKISDVCIGVDVIVGFPGETDSDFQETYSFLLNLDISYLHVFSYSERDNTEASKMLNPLPKNVRYQSSKMMRSLSEKKRRIFYNSQINRVRPVLFESENKHGYIYGYTDNYIKVRHPWNPKLSNNIVQAKLIEIDNDGFVRIKLSEKKLKKEKQYLYSYSNW